MNELRTTQQCPICGAEQPRSARKCSICGAVLPGELAPIVPVPPVAEKPKRGTRPRYDPAGGEDDLFVGDLTGRMWRLVLVAAVGLALLLGLGLGIVIARWSSDDDPDPRTEAIHSDRPTAPPTSTPRGYDGATPDLTGAATTASEPAATATLRPVMTLPTVTTMPPTPTETPTPGPCYQTAQQGDTLYGMALRCGHVDMSVVDVILELNNMTNPQQLQLGQTLEIPWPTPTPGAAPVQPSESAPDDSTSSSGADTALAAGVRLNEFGTPDALAKYEGLEPTLRPGMAWHAVVEGDTIMGIAYQYDTSVELLSQINPETPFMQCDYGERYGGPNCSVMLYQGQRIRVPVAVPTITPTPSPSVRTATPTPTPTFNAPYLISPDDGAHFDADQMVTLRWGGTGTLGPNERYVVYVRDQDLGKKYVATVTETTYILPGGWQPGDRNRHHFEWYITIGVVDRQFNVMNEDHITGTRKFSWDSR